MDPQGHCGVGLGVPEDRIEQGLAEALLAEPPGGVDPNVMLWEVAKNLRLAPSTLSLAGLEAARGGLANLPDRDARLVEWAKAPSAREAHPREEHLIPLLVAAGAAGEDAGRRVFTDVVMGARVSAYRFG